MGLFKKLFHSEDDDVDSNTFERSSEFAALAGMVNEEDDDDEDIEEQEILEGITEDDDDLDDYN